MAFPGGSSASRGPGRPRPREIEPSLPAYPLPAVRLSTNPDYFSPLIPSFCPVWDKIGPG
jgi:hypothetical protein